jgi:hypothetical protein
MTNQMIEGSKHGIQSRCNGYVPEGIINTHRIKRDRLIAGTGSCLSCDCRGFMRSQDKGYCKCGHHWDRHV